MTPALDLEGFCAALGRELEISVDARDADTPLRDLAFDSLLTFEMLLVVEDFSGATVPDALIPQLQTLADVYHLYCTRVTQ